MDIYYTIDINPWNQVIQDSIIICNNNFFFWGGGWVGGVGVGVRLREVDGMVGLDEDYKNTVLLLNIELLIFTPKAWDVDLVMWLQYFLPS